MKRVLISLLFVLVVGCADTGPDSDWECPSCHWGVGKNSVKCSNCGDQFMPQGMSNYQIPIQRQGKGSPNELKPQANGRIIGD